MKRLEKIATLPAADQRAILKFVDALVHHGDAPLNIPASDETSGWLIPWAASEETLIQHFLDRIKHNSTALCSLS